MKTAVLSLVATLALSVPVAAATMTFEDFATGTEVNSLDFGGGITATVVTNSTRSVSNGGTNLAAVFDTNAFTGNDNDLVSPFTRTSNPSEGANLGKVLVIAGPSNGGTNPNGVLPDDDRQGGIITFSFNQLVNFNSVDYVDTESGNNELVISFFDSANSLLGTSGDLVAGNAQFDTFATSFTNVSSIAFAFGGSGALDNLSVSAVPVPAALPLLAAGLGVFGFMSRRRRKA